MNHYEIKIVTTEKVKEEDILDLLGMIHRAAESIIGMDKIHITAKKKGIDKNGKERLL